MVLTSSENILYIWNSSNGQLLVVCEGRWTL